MWRANPNHPQASVSSTTQPQPPTCLSIPNPPLPQTGLSILLDYFNMLIAMTFNVGLFVAVVMGYVLGILAFTHLAENYTAWLKETRYVQLEALDNTSGGGALGGATGKGAPGSCPCGNDGEFDDLEAAVEGGGKLTAGFIKGAEIGVVRQPVTSGVTVVAAAARGGGGGDGGGMLGGATRTSSSSSMAVGVDPNEGNASTCCN